ncbi:MAG: helix-turn-helix transcriptional regulator [Candidatus Gastranaerophilales bacterium]|nr:helix-turn-helix transcriptional regulator [Candidatus Gastranaerophilales bacterium]
MSEINERLKSIRNQKNLTQADFGKNIGVSKQAVSNVENNLSNPSIELLSKLMMYYDVNLNWLICGKGNMFNTTQFEQVQDEFAQKVKEILKDEGLIK